ncbi:MAG: queuosine precursor transporter [Acidaminococcaceae bacterium]|nr:queuosine precursor transporter [Acidaminococcaceae bacterium]
MNTVYLFLEILICFSAVVLIGKLFGKNGLIAWVGIASVLANIITAKTSNILGLDAAQGSVLFASTFLATDILCEKYGKKEAKTGVLVGLFSSVALIVATQIALLYSPVEYDYADAPMQVLFGLNLRITASSIVMYLIANLADIAVFDKLKQMTGGKWLWLRNNVATILCNCIENFGFIFLAFLGIYSAGQCFEIAIATSVIEIVAAVCDTPFAYLGRKLEPLRG